MSRAQWVTVAVYNKSYINYARRCYRNKYSNLQPFVLDIVSTSGCVDIGMVTLWTVHINITKSIKTHIFLFATYYNQLLSYVFFI